MWKGGDAEVILVWKIKYQNASQKKILLGFLEFVHHHVFWIEHNASETGSISVLIWKDWETPTQVKKLISAIKPVRWNLPSLSPDDKPRLAVGTKFIHLFTSFWQERLNLITNFCMPSKGCLCFKLEYTKGYRTVIFCSNFCIDWLFFSDIHLCRNLRIGLTLGFSSLTSYISWLTSLLIVIMTFTILLFW